jgi:predicted nuclease of restriction endonuclease-like (RecB) superfamily
MRAFAAAYPHFPMVQPAVAQMSETTAVGSGTPVMQPMVAQISWSHHIILLDKLKDQQLRFFYMQKIIENGWTRDMLANQIESGLHQRLGALPNNFDRTISVTQSKAVQRLFKDPYTFDFLHLEEEASERDLENALLTHITDMLLELGDGFTFKSRQYRLEAGGQEFFLDLLFYHKRLRRYIVIDLKIGEFQPEFAGKMNFYLGLVDDKLREAGDEPAIGLILCKTRNRIIAEYALRDTSKPIGIAEYRIGKILPEDIKGELPSIEELEQKLDEELKQNIGPIESRMHMLKERLNALKVEEVQTAATFPLLQKLYTEGLRPLYLNIIEKLSAFDDFFTGKSVVWMASHKHLQKIEQVDQLWNDEQALRGIRDFFFEYSYYGFRKAGTRNFAAHQKLKIEISDYWYGFSIDHYKQGQHFLKKLYHQQLLPAEQQHITEILMGNLMDSMEWMINNVENS